MALEAILIVTQVELPFMYVLVLCSYAYAKTVHGFPCAYEKHTCIKYFSYELNSQMEHRISLYHILRSFDLFPMKLKYSF